MRAPLITIRTALAFLFAGCNGPLPDSHVVHDRAIERPDAPKAAVPVDAEKGAATSAPTKDGGHAPETGTSQTSVADAHTLVPRPEATVRGAYPGTGFVMHEWGTNTIVVGSDGSLQRGLHHEGDDLPPFVYDRLTQGDLLTYPSVDKMETPVDYFYADHPLTATVSVEMPHGVLTQWYPAVTSFAPPVLMPGDVPLLDPAAEVHYGYRTSQCRDKYTTLGGGKLDWGSVQILPRNLPVAPALPEASLDRYSWSYARDVAANPVRVENPASRSGGSPTGLIVKGPQAEKFLFYRGLGNFPVPLNVTAHREPEGIGTVQVANQSEWTADGPVLLLDVGPTTGAFSVLAASLAPGETRSAPIPTLAGAESIDRFVETLASTMTEALDGTGLYHDEAIAMVNTWRRQWFRTPGVRVLYFAPGAFIEKEVPITVQPAPDSTTRVMVMRVEVLTVGVEAEDLHFASLLDGAAEESAAEGHFRSLGRFAEPRLRRALGLLGAMPAHASAFLSDIESPNASLSMGD